MAQIPGVVISKPRRRRFWWFVAAGLILMVGLVAAALAFGDWLDLNATGPGHFPSSLLWAVPTPAPSATYDNLAGKDAEYLNSTDHGAQDGKHLTYVPPSAVSTGATVISVNPIDPYTWAAVALNYGACYGILMAENPSHPAYGDTYYAKFPKGTPCKGSVATRRSVKSPNVPL
jgi:hypothetical protein